MKKIKTLFILVVMIITANGYGQNSCLSATTLSPSDTIIQLSTNDSVAWFLYQTNSTYLKLSLISPDLLDASSLVAQYSDIHLYSGSYNNLTEVSDIDSLSTFMFSNNNLSYPETYYIKVNYKSTWQAYLYIEKIIPEFQNSLLTCTHNCNLISNGNFSATTAIYDEVIPFYYGKINCWCAAWGSPFLHWFYSGLPTPLSNNSIGIGCGYISTTPGNPNNFNGSEGVYQNINIESNRTYNLSFKYVQYVPFDATKGAILHVLITSQTFGCTGNSSDGFSPIPSISNIVWHWSNTVVQNGNLSNYYTFSQPISIPILNPTPLNAQYKLLFYVEFDESTPYRRYVLFDDVSLTPQANILTINHSNSGTVCPNTAVTLSANISPTSIYTPTYLWSNGATTSSIIVTPLETTAYSCTVTDINGCITTNSYTVPVYSIPTPIITGNISVCKGQSYSYSTLTGKTNYIWNVSAGGTIITSNSNLITVLWNTAGNQTIGVTYTDGVCTMHTTLNLNVYDPIADAGIDREYCKSDINSETLGGNPTASGAPSPFTYSWTDQNGNYVSNSSNPVVNPTITTTYTVVVSSSGCSASDNLTITVIAPQIPIITGNRNNCELTSTYTIDNPGSNSVYSWVITSTISGTPVAGTIIAGQNTPSITVNWNTIDIDNPAILTVTNTENGCTATTTINIYDCCTKGYDNVLHDVTITNPLQIPTSSLAFVGTIIFDCDITISNQIVGFGGPSTKIIVAPGRKLTIDNASVLREGGCHTMWDGIYVSDPTSEVEVNGNSTIRDAINGIVSDYGGKFTLNDANMTDNLYNVRVHNYTDPTQHTGTIKNTRFNGTMLSIPPCIGKKTFCGVESAWVNGVLKIGEETNVANLNTFQNMQYGVNAANSNLNIVNNKFLNIQVNSVLFPFPFPIPYIDGAVFATNSLPWFTMNFPFPIGSWTFTPSFDIKVGGNGLKRNYFDNCKTGVYTYKNQNTIENNDFNNCGHGIRSIDVADKSKYTNNTIYGDLSNGITPGYGIDLRNVFANPKGIGCLVDSNDITNKCYAISLISLSGDGGQKNATVQNNIINYFVSPPPNYVNVPSTAKQIGIWIQNCHYSQTRLNTIIRNYPIQSAASGEGENVLGIRIAESRKASVFQNNILRMGSGIFTNGLLTNTQFDCNIFYYDHYGFQFALPSSITDQGSPSGYNPNNRWEDYNPQNSRMYAPNLALTNPFTYYYDPTGIAYDPTVGMTPNLYIDPQQNPGATSLCLTQTGPVGPPPEDPNTNLDAREAAFGQIVRNEKYYAYLEEEYRLKDREYVYEMLRNYPELINMGGEDDNLYLQFYNDGYQSDIEKVIEMREEMYEQNLALAMEKLAQIADDNTINTNRKIASGIYLDTWASNKYELNQEQTAALTTLAFLTPYAGGDAVYAARVMLDINPDEIGVDYAIGPSHSQTTNKELNAFVYPNPAKDKITIKFNDVITCNGNIEFFGMMGNLVYSATITKDINEIQINVNSLKSGLYFYTVKVNNTKITSGKITIINN